MTIRHRLLLAAAFAAALAGAPARAAEFTETFTPFAGWESRWFGSSTNAANFYGSEPGGDPSYQGAPDVEGLYLSDGDNYLSPVADYSTVVIRFADAFARSLTRFDLDVASAVDGISLTFFDLSNNRIGTFTVPASPDLVSSPDGTPRGYSRYGVTSATGIGGFTFGTNAQGNVIVDNLFASDAAVPEPAAWTMMIVGLGVTGAAMRRRRTAVRWA